MRETVEQKASSYRWLVLLVIFFTHITLNILIFQIGGLASLLIPALQILPTQLAMVLSIPMLTCAIFGIPAGGLADRFGVKRVVGVGLILSTIGSFGRIGANSFGVLLAWMFILGFGLACLNANAVKILGAWFPPRQIGLAMGIYVAGACTGITIALATSALFSSRQSAFTASAIMLLGATVLWLLFIKSKPADAPDLPLQPFTEYLGVAAKSKYVWIGATALFFMMGTFVTQSGFLPNALTQGKGIDPVSAGLVASSLTFASIAGMVIVPMVSNKVGLIRPFLTPVVFLGAVTAYLAWNVPFGPLTWVFLIVNGFLIGGSVPLIMSLPMLLPEIGPVYAGSAGGILSTLQMAGAFILSSYVIMPLAGENVDRVFLYIGLGYLIYALITIFLPELGSKARTKNSGLSM